jgi:TonB family protein
LAGEVRFALRISFDGRVYSVRIQESSLPSGDAQKCLLEVWRSMRFPTPRGAGGLTVVYPVKFSPG